MLFSFNFSIAVTRNSVPKCSGAVSITLLFHSFNGRFSSLPSRLLRFVSCVAHSRVLNEVLFRSLLRCSLFFRALPIDEAFRLVLFSDRCDALFSLDDICVKQTSSSFGESSCFTSTLGSHFSLALFSNRFDDFISNFPSRPSVRRVSFPSSSNCVSFTVREFSTTISLATGISSLFFSMGSSSGPSGLVV
uniref:Uncharacterized protein n=1 Tax=Parascaris univalens TaxID=6257 RepID=A0A915BB22_PARUN